MLAFHLEGMRRLCGEGSWCSSQRAGEVDERFESEVEVSFGGEVEVSFGGEVGERFEVLEKGRRGGRERLAPGSRTIIRDQNQGFDNQAAEDFWNL